MTTRLALSCLLFTGCVAAKLDPALEGRRACWTKLHAPEIRSAESFRKLGLRERQSAAFFGNAEEGRRKLLCAVSAYEASTAVDTTDPESYRILASLYESLGKQALAREALEKLRGLKRE